MRPISFANLALVTLLGLGATFCTDAGEKPRRHYPKPTPPPPPSPIYKESSEHAHSEEEISRMAANHNARLADDLESALLSKDPARREAAFVFVLPELVQVDAQRVVEMVARQPEGEPRDTLRTELTRAWIARDPAGAMKWMKTLPHQERRASGAAAVDFMFPQNPTGAAALADELGMASLVRERRKPDRD
jgi:hypothetical protein